MKIDRPILLQAEGGCKEAGGAGVLGGIILKKTKRRVPGENRTKGWVGGWERETQQIFIKGRYICPEGETKPPWFGGVIGGEKSKMPILFLGRGNT